MIELIKKYSDFEGVSSREEYWSVLLVVSVVYFGVITLAINLIFEEPLGYFEMSIMVASGILGLLLIVATSVRRCRDAGISPWWSLVTFVPYVGIVTTLIVGIIGRKMTQLFKITPINEHCIEVFYDVYEELDDGSTRGWTVTETYQWGAGYRELDDPVYKNDTSRVRCNFAVGPGIEISNLHACSFDFDESYTEQERDDIKNSWRTGDGTHSGYKWLAEIQHRWQIEDYCAYILHPVRIDVVSKIDYNQILVENISPKEPIIPMAPNNLLGNVS